MLNCDCCRAIPFHCAQKEDILFKKLSIECVFKFISLTHTYEEDLALNNLRWLICHNTKPTSTDTSKLQTFKFIRISLKQNTQISNIFFISVYLELTNLFILTWQFFWCQHISIKRDENLQTHLDKKWIQNPERHGRRVECVNSVIGIFSQSWLFSSSVVSNAFYNFNRPSAHWYFSILI